MKIPNTIKLKDGRKVVCKIYDNGGRSFDRYTIALKARRHNGRLYWPYLASSENPFHPQGFGQHGESEHPVEGSYLGKRISFDSLPEQVQSFILGEF